MDTPADPNEEVMDVDPAPVQEEASVKSTNPTSFESGHEEEPEPKWIEYVKSVDTVLGGGMTVALHQEFLIRNNHTDLQILKNTKVCVCVCDGVVYNV